MFATKNTYYITLIIEFEIKDRTAHALLSEFFVSFIKHLTKFHKTVYIFDISIKNKWDNIYIHGNKNALLMNLYYIF